MDKGGGFIAVLIVWGGLFYLFSASPLAVGISNGNDNFFAAAASSFEGVFGGTPKTEGLLGVISQDNNFQNSFNHSAKSSGISQIEVSPMDPSLAFAATNSGVLASKDSGLNWYDFSDVEHKIGSSAVVYKILFNPDNKKESFISVFSGGEGIVYKSENNFFSLEKIMGFEGEAAYDMAVKNNNLYLGLSNGKLIVYSLDKKESKFLTAFSSPITGLKISQAGNLIYLTLKSGGLYLSNNASQSFSRLNYLDGYKGANKINDFYVSPLDASLVYAATDYGLVRSFDAGSTWKVFKSLPSEEARVSAVALDCDGNIFTASGDKIYKSRDSGQNWQIIETGFKGKEISAIVFSGNKVIIGSK